VLDFLLNGKQPIFSNCEVCDGKMIDGKADDSNYVIFLNHVLGLGAGRRFVLTDTGDAQILEG
jgi:hypothetical protein